jgi:hypothetical protein
MCKREFGRRHISGDMVLDALRTLSPPQVGSAYLTNNPAGFVYSCYELMVDWRR